MNIKQHFSRRRIWSPIQAPAVGLAAALVALSLGLHAQSPVQAPSQSTNATMRALPTSSLTSSSTPWGDLSAKQRVALAPLQQHWNQIAPDHQQKWIEIATRFPSMPPQEQTRIQARMTEWAQLSPQERGRARLRFQEAKRLPLTDRQAKWEEFQSLTPEQRHELSERAALAARTASAPIAASSAARIAAERHAAAASATRGDGVVARATSANAGAAREVARTNREEAIAPAIVQARPGVTTTLMSKRASLAQHPKASIPRIAATSDNINAATLLPRRPAPPAAVKTTESVHEPEASSGQPSAPVQAPTTSPRQSMEMPNPEFYK